MALRELGSVPKLNYVNYRIKGSSASWRWRRRTDAGRCPGGPNGDAEGEMEEEEAIGRDVAGVGIGRRRRKTVGYGSIQRPGGEGEEERRMTNLEKANPRRQTGTLEGG